MDKRTGRFAFGALLAGIIGYIAGILTAPKSGKETREDIKDTTQATIAEAEKKLKEVHTELSKQIAEATAKAEKLKGSAKTEAENVVEASKKVKEKVRISLSSIHDGSESDKDLQKAVKEAQKSIEHLTKFLKK
jgi:gas vesicle protein